MQKLEISKRQMIREIKEKSKQNKNLSQLMSYK